MKASASAKSMGSPEQASSPSAHPRTVAPSASVPQLPTHVQRNRLTPRSAEACRRTGIEPSELLPLPREAFREVGQTVEVEKLRWEKYEAMRVDAYQAVRAERERIIAEQGDGVFVEDAALVAGRGAGGGGSTAGSPSRASSNAQAAAEAAAKEAEAAGNALEARVLEKVKKKQQAEIEQMLMFEIRAAQLTKEKADKVLAMQQADEREKKERQARAKAASELRLKQELERREAEVRADRESRRRQRLEIEKEVKRKAEEEELERQRLVELDKRERERIAKQEARRQRQQELLAASQEAAYAKQEEEAERERARMFRLEEKRQMEAEAAAIQRERSQQRIARTIAMREERSDQMRANYAKKMAAEEERRLEWAMARQAQVEARRRAGEEKAQHIKEVQQMMELTVEARKNEIIGKEREHLEIKAKADEERQKMLAISATEKEMKMFTRQLKMARHQRKDEYKREVVAAKVRLKLERTDELLARKQDTLTRRRLMRADNSLARQAVAERIDKMRQSSSFDVDEEMRGYIQNPELQELLERCDERTNGSSKVSLDVMRGVLQEMQSEGKLASMGGGGGHGAGGPAGGNDGGMARPKSAGELGR